MSLGPAHGCFLCVWGAVASKLKRGSCDVTVTCQSRRGLRRAVPASSGIRRLLVQRYPYGITVTLVLPLAEPLRPASAAEECHMT